MTSERIGNEPLPVGMCAQVACVWEATARKPGNVHPHQDFAATTYVDFILSAAAIGPHLEAAAQAGAGQTILNAVRATRAVVGSNTNLGIVLLLAPLAAVPQSIRLVDGVGPVLDNLTVKDALAAYEAIRLAAPGGLGRVDEQDVVAKPTQTLKEVMALAADRDLIARQYVNGFAEVLGDGVPAFVQGLANYGNLEDAIIYCYLKLMSNHPDSLIARKLGRPVAEEAAHRAKEVIANAWPVSAVGHDKMRSFDAWLRDDGNRKNPGTTADLVTACLFVALRESSITLPSPYPWSVAR